MTCQEQKSYNLGFVTQYAKAASGKWIFSERAQDMIKLVCNKGHHVYLIRLDETIKNNFVLDCLYVNDNTIKAIDIRNLDCLNFSWAGKSIESLSLESNLNHELKFFCSLVELLEKADKKPLMVNPINTILENLSKDYYFTFKNKVPFLETTAIESKEQLLTLAKSKKILIAKPLISERSEGTLIINNKPEEELLNYYEKYNKANKKNSYKTLYEKIYSKQKIIVQPYNDLFLNVGEKKIYLANGKVKLARRMISKEKRKILDFHKGDATDIYYEPTEKEIKICEEVYSTFNKVYPISYMRLDIISSEYEFYVNEIEVINPDWAESDVWIDIDQKILKSYLEKFRLALYEKIISSLKDDKFSKLAAIRGYPRL